jgi:LmbE family N-acetylglucosaminyl deacetylase
VAGAPASRDAETDRARLERVRRGDAGLRAVLVAGHPDDETLGASLLLARLPSTVVVHLTDGAPADARLRSPSAPASRAAYADLRRRECLAALAIAGLGADRVLSLGAEDQQAAFALPALTRRLERLLARVRPAVVVTHAYEGGHPDHDAAALATQLAARRLAGARPAAPTRLEMTSYHGLGGRFVTGAFLPGPATGDGAADDAPVVLSAADLDRKRRMLACYASQRQVIETFALEREAVRLAPTYDFTAPPHPGALRYEQLGWPLTGDRWRALAAEATAALAACR